MMEQQWTFVASAIIITDILLFPGLSDMFPTVHDDGGSGRLSNDRDLSLANETNCGHN